MLASASVTLILSLSIATDVVGVIDLGTKRTGSALRLRDELTRRGNEVVVGVDGILSRSGAAQSEPLEPLRSDVAQLVKQGEDLMLAFEHARAAALLGEAAALLEPTLSPANLETWTRARTLAGVAWVEAGNTAGARDVFTRLLALHPDVVPDAALLSPAARAVFDAARGDVTARGTGTLEIQIERGAPVNVDVDVDILVDGRARGRAPLSLVVVAGTHRVVVSAPGYERSVVVVDVSPGAIAAARASLVPAPLRRMLDALEGDRPAPVRPALDDVVAEAKLDALYVLDETGGVLRVRRFGEAPSIAHVPLDPLDPAATATLATTALTALDASTGTRSAIDTAPALLGVVARPVAGPAVAEQEKTATVDDGDSWLLYGAIGGGALLVVAAAAAATAIAVWPPPPPQQRQLAVVVELPPP